jgi:hypothetical protein
VLVVTGKVLDSAASVKAAFIGALLLNNHFRLFLIVCNNVFIDVLAVAGKVFDSASLVNIMSVTASSIFFKTNSALVALFSFPAFFSYQSDHKPIIN